VERQQGRQGQTSMALAQLMTNYAFLLASQGSFNSALGYLESAHEVYTYNTYRNTANIISHDWLSING
jgi:hypothetical protein